VKRKFNHLTATDRVRLEAGIKHGLSKKAIANELGVHISTIYREIKRGEYQHKVSKYDFYGDKSYKFVTRYSPIIAQEKYRQNLTAKGAPLKIGRDYSLSQYIENKIVNEGLTPLAVIGEIKKQNLHFETTICVRTLYSYIEKGVFLQLDLKHLPIKGKRKKKKQRTTTITKAPKGESIEKRPIEINDRSVFGHWEMDCICGPTKNSLLTLSERLTRKEIIIPIANQKAESVVKALNGIERKYGKQFRKIFKSITVDNGVEFSDCIGLEKSIYGNFKRTKMFYCHPYCSSERGTNERMNREIRRKFPKGTNFKKISTKQVKEVETWINNYPRFIHNFATSNELFNHYIATL